MSHHCLPSLEKWQHCCVCSEAVIKLKVAHKTKEARDDWVEKSFVLGGINVTQVSLQTHRAVWVFLIDLNETHWFLDLSSYIYSAIGNACSSPQCQWKVNVNALKGVSWVSAFKTLVSAVHIFKTVFVLYIQNPRPLNVRWRLKQLNFDQSRTQLL